MWFWGSDPEPHRQPGKHSISEICLSFYKRLKLKYVRILLLIYQNGKNPCLVRYQAEEPQGK